MVIALGTAINYEYQAGGDEATLRSVARAIRDLLDPTERATFTESIEMCGLVLDADAPSVAVGLMSFGLLIAVLSTANFVLYALVYRLERSPANDRYSQAEDELTRQGDRSRNGDSGASCAAVVGCRFG